MSEIAGHPETLEPREDRAARVLRLGVLAIGAAMVLVLTQVAPNVSYIGLPHLPGPLWLLIFGFGLLLMPVLLVASWVAGGRASVPHPWLTVPVALFIAGAAISTAMAADKSAALVRAAEMSGVWLGFWALAQAIRTDAERRVLLAALVAAGLVAAALAIFQAAAGAGSGPVERELVARLAGGGAQAAMGSPALLGAFLALAVLVALGFAMEKWAESASRSARYLAVAATLAAVVCAVGVFLARSPGGMAALALGFYLVVVTRQVRRPRARWALYVAPLIAGAAAVAIWRWTSIEAYWQAAWPVLRSHGLAGVGLGNFELHYLLHKPPAAPERAAPLNMFLAAWSELGLAGLVAVVILVAVAARAWTRSAPGEKGSGAQQTKAPDPPSGRATEKLGGLVLAATILAGPAVVYFFLLGGRLGALALGATAVAIVLISAEDWRQLNPPARTLRVLRTACIAAIVAFWAADQFGAAAFAAPTAWAMFLVLATTLAPTSPERRAKGVRSPTTLRLLTPYALGAPAQFALMVLAMLACFAYTRYILYPMVREEAYLKLAGQSTDLDGQDELLCEAARANPLGWEADYWRGRVWQGAAESGQPGSGPPAADRAIAAYQAALARQPLLREAWLGMAETILARPGALDDPRALQSARQCLEEAARLDPAGLAIAVRLADVLDREKEDEAAVRQYIWVLELDRLAPPESPRLSDKQRQDVEARLKQIRISVASPDSAS